MRWLSYLTSTDEVTVTQYQTSQKLERLEPANARGQNFWVGINATIVTRLSHDLKRYGSLESLNFDFNNQTHIKGEGHGERPGLRFFLIKNKYPDLSKKLHDCVHLWVKFQIWNAVLRTSRLKNSKIFPCEPFPWCIVGKIGQSIQEWTE